MLGAVTLSPTTLEPIIIEMAQKYSIDPAWIKAHIKAESNWDVNASRYEAHKGDASWGLMQLLLKTAQDVLGNPSLNTTQLMQPRVNIEAGSKFLSQLYSRYGNMQDAMAAYNAGSPRRTADGKYVNQAYVDKVMKNYNVYSALGSGIVAETTIDVEEAVTSEDAVPMYLILGVGLLGLVIMTRE
jgi:soluble lytic murein transglycosylase-like protein